MKDGFIKVAAISPQMKVADVAFNTTKICEKIDEAVKEKAKIAVFPQLCITGYTCGDLFFQRTLLASAKEALCRIIDHTEGLDMLVFVGLPMEKNHKLYNVAAAICDGQLLAIIPKTYVPGYGEYSESRYFTAGNTVAQTYLFEKDGEIEEIPFGTHVLLQCDGMDDLVVGCEIGSEAECALAPSVTHAMAGATLIVNLSAVSAGVSKEKKLESLLEVTSSKLMCGYVMANAGYGESTQDMVMSGLNLIYESGCLLSKNVQFSGETVYSEIDVQKLVAERMRNGGFDCDSQGDYIFVSFALEEDVTSLTRNIPKSPFVPEDEQVREQQCEEILEIQARGLAKRMAHIGAKTAVLGISGGLDSTLALLVVAKAFDILDMDHNGIKAITMLVLAPQTEPMIMPVLWQKHWGVSSEKLILKNL